MEISYSDNKLKKLCEDEREMRKRRSDIEAKLKLRIAALRASLTLADLVRNDPLGRWHRLSSDREGQWAGSVSANERIVIELTSNSVRVVGIERELQSTEVRVLEIVDYHHE